MTSAKLTKRSVAVQRCSSPLSGGPRKVSFGDLHSQHAEEEPEGMAYSVTSGVLIRVVCTSCSVSWRILQLGDGKKGGTGAR